MNNLEEVVADQHKRIKQMEEFISLYLKKREVLSDLIAISSKMKDVKPLVEECSVIVDKYHIIAVAEYKRLVNKMKEQQLTMLNIIKELKKRKSSNLEEVIPASKSCVTPLRAQSKENSNLASSSSSVPRIGHLSSSIRRMCLSDYKQSPFVSKLRPVALQFLDFEAHITHEMFESIPRYIRGRETLSELEAFLEQVITPCFTEKYQIFYKNRSALRNSNETKLWELYREQAHKFPGLKFITQGDISRKINKLIDKKVSGKILMLRHLSILKEQKERSTVYYFWVYKSD